jgi:glutamate-ammonia-ligase adenylyltransferase
MADVEFLLQMFRLKYGRDLPALRATNTWDALGALRDAGLVSAEEHYALRTCYDFLRLTESRLRIVHNRSLDELPENPEDLEKLARRLDFEPGARGSAADQFLARLDEHLSQTRALFLRLLERERATQGPPVPAGGGIQP